MQNSDSIHFKGKQNDKPLVSVIIPTKNRPLLLSYALESLIDQTYDNWQAIVINDGGCDVGSVISSLDTGRGKIYYIRTPVSKGHAAARNIGLGLSQGEIITYLDDDNIFFPSHLEVVVKALTAHQESVVFTQGEWVVETIQNGQRVDVKKDYPYVSIEHSLNEMLVKNYVDLACLAHKKSCLNKIKGFDESLTALVDWDLVLALASHYDIRRLEDITVQVRSRNAIVDNVSRRERKNFYDLFYRIYKKYPVSDESILEKRKALLNFFKIERDSKSQAKMADPAVPEGIGSLDEVFERALKAHELIGGSLIAIVSSILSNKIPDAVSKNIQNSLSSNVSNFILEELEGNSKSENSRLSCKYGNAGEVMTHLRERLKENQRDSEIRDVLDRICAFEQNYYYQQWIIGHALLEIDGQLFAERMMLQWQSRPVFHLVLFLFPGEDELLADTIDSLAAQMYSQWRFSVIAGEPCPDPVFDQFEALQWVRVEQNENPYAVLNAVIDGVEADWVAFIEPGAIFQPHTLIRLGDYINLNRDWHFIYVDEDEKGPDGLRSNSRFKPDFNLDLLRSDFYIGGFCAIKREKLLEIGGIQATPDFENYDLAFKIFEKYGAGVFCHIADVLYHAPESSRRTRDTNIKRIVVENHLIRSRVPASIDEGYLHGTHRIIYHHTNTPKVSVIIPTRDKLEFFQPCIESLMEKTDYPDFEVLVVNNQSIDPDILQYFEELPDLYSGRVRVLEYDEEFNFSAISNLAARHANGQYLLFLNNDTEIIQSQWLSRMMLHAQRPEVGIVGVRLVLPESGLVQHVGVVLGLDLVADHPYSGLIDIQSPGYMGRALLDQNYSAVTGACLLVRSEVYRAVEGMDEENFPISYNDIDLCLKVKQAGFLVVYTPYATLIHHSSVSQKSERNPEEVARRNAVFCNSRDKMFDKWRDIIANDPSYNRNLSLTSREFKVDSSLPCNWDVNFHDRQRVLGLPLSGGAGDYRIILPFEALSRSGMMQCEYIRLLGNQSRRLNAAEIERLAPDTLVVHSALNDLELTYLEELKRLNKNLFIVFALDDLVTQIPKKSSVYANFMRNYRDAKPRLRKALSLCDRLVVSTEPLADLCRDMIDDIHIVPNRLNKEVWCDLSSLRQQGTKPRVGWAGAQQHQGDLEIIFDVVKETADEIDWIFMGMCPQDIVPYVKESHEFVPFKNYPAKLASLNLDLAIAPLEDCQFNDAKSNLRLLEYGILGWPVVCSDVFPYRSHDAPVTRVKNDKQEWLSAIRDCLSDLDSNYSAGDKLRQWVLERFILEDHLDEWQRALMR